MRADYLSAQEAATRLGVSPATLYAYVSRGKIDSRPGADGRSREYLADDIERLIERRQAGRGAAKAAARSLTWGLETNWVFRAEGPLKLRILPQIHLELTPHTKLQLGAGLTISSGEISPFAAARWVFD